MPIDLTLELTTLRLRGRPQDKDRKAEPNLWTAFFKYDGATVSVSDGLRVTGAATVDARPQGRTHASFGGATIRADEQIPIPPAVGRWTSRLQEIALPVVEEIVDDVVDVLEDAADTAGGVVGEAADTAGGVVGGVTETADGIVGGVLRTGRPRGRGRGGTALASRSRPRAGTARTGLPGALAPVAGVVFVLLEWDHSQDATIDAAKRAFHGEITRILNERVLADGLVLRNPVPDAEEQRALQSRVEQAVRAAALAQVVRGLDLGSVVDPDDLLGAGALVVSASDVPPGGKTTLRHRFDREATDRRGDWELEAVARRG